MVFRRRTLYCVLAGLTTLLVFSSLMSFGEGAAEEGTVIETAAGLSTISAGGVTVYAQSGDAFYSGCTLQTKGNGAPVSIAFGDGSALTAGEKTTLRFISADISERRRNTHKFKFGIGNGRILFIPSPFGACADFNAGKWTIRAEATCEISVQPAYIAVYAPDGNVEILEDENRRLLSTDGGAIIARGKTAQIKSRPDVLTPPLAPWTQTIHTVETNSPPEVHVKITRKGLNFILDSSSSFDPDGDPLKIELYYSRDGGETYILIAGDLETVVLPEE